MRVLLLGDSHTFGTYGSTLETLFRDTGNDVLRVGWVGATARSYLTGTQERIGLGGTGDFAAAVSQPWDVVVLTLGTNDAAALPAGGKATSAAQNIRALADKFGGSVVWYVGPPAFSEKAARTYNPAFASESLIDKADRLWNEPAPLFERSIDPRAATAPFVKDGDIHFGPKGGKAWATAVFDTVSQGGGAIVPTTGGSAGSGKAIVAVGLLALLGIGFVLWRSRRK